MHSSRFISFITLFHTFASASAQSSMFNTSNYSNCPGRAESFAPNAAVNSTGKIEFQFGKSNGETNSAAISNKWYLSATFNDTQRQDTGSAVEQELRGWLSVEARSSGYICAYQLGGVNASATSSGSNGCDGVLRPACVSALQNATNPHKVDDSDSCPPIMITDEVKKVCTNDTTNPGFLQYIRSTAKPINLSNQTCTIQSPQQVSIPGDYRTYVAINTKFAPNETDLKASSFDWYDIHVQQSIPWVIAGYMKPFTNSDEIRSDSQIICVSPNTVVGGSRQPSFQYPHMQNNQSSGNSSSGQSNPGKHSGSLGAGWRSAWKLAVSVAGATVPIGVFL